MPYYLPVQQFVPVRCMQEHFNSMQPTMQQTKLSQFVTTSAGTPPDRQLYPRKLKRFFSIGVEAQRPTIVGMRKSAHEQRRS